MSNPEAQELLTRNLPVIDRAVAFVCRRYRFDADAAEEFAAHVRLKIVEDDYAILRAFEQRSSFATYIATVVQRLALDYRIQLWGKWHTSAAAKRLGPLAVDLEQLLARDGRSIDDALPILTARHAGVTRESLEALAAELPQRGVRRREVAVDDIEPAAVAIAADAEEMLLDPERREVSRRVGDVMAAMIERLPEDERLVIQLRFENGMTVAQIARALQLDQKLTYRRIERRMREMKEELMRAGLASHDVLDLIGRDEALVHFDFGKSKLRPSIAGDEAAQAQTEGSQ